MDRAIIIGAFEFLGFHFCQTLLEEGYEVVGVHNSKNEEIDFLELKRMAIGRNANFQEESLAQWLGEAEIDEQTLVIIDYYDLFIRNAPDLPAVNKLMDLFLSRNEAALKQNHSKVVWLLPIQWLLPENRLELNRIKTYSHRYFLPSIYGPWQPDTFLLQQGISKDHSQLTLNKREWIDDCLYIDDIVEEILNMTERREMASLILRSSIDNHWQKCAEFISIPEKFINIRLSDEEAEFKSIERKQVKCKLPISEGIEKQIRHYRLFISAK